MTREIIEVTNESGHNNACQYKDALTKILDELGEGSLFLYLIFLLTIFPTIFSGMHSNTYIFMAEVQCKYFNFLNLYNFNGPIKRNTQQVACMGQNFDNFFA